MVCMWLLVLVPPLVYTNSIRDGFRLPKLVLCESLTLLSFLLLLVSACSSNGIDWHKAVRRPAFVAFAPLTGVVALGLLTSTHQLHLRPALFSFVIGIAAILIWSAGFDFATHRKLLLATVVPGVILAVVAILQFHEIYTPIRFDPNLAARLKITSFAGNPFDLSAFLVLPALILQVQLGLSLAPRVRAALTAALGLCLYGIVATQTITVFIAVGAGSVFVWARVLPRKRVVAVSAAGAVLVAVMMVALPPLRARLVQKAEKVKTIGIDELFTGRLDGWKTALWMVEQNPVFGVGHGAYRAEFGNAKVALFHQGERFYLSQTQVFFANAHDDYLEAAAEWGLLGVAAAAWAVWNLAKTLRRRVEHFDAGKAGQRADATLLMAGVLALAIMMLTNFPLRIALVAYPYLMLISAVYAHAGDPA